MCLPGLVPELQLPTLPWIAHGAGEHLVDRLGTEAAAQHQQPQRTLASVVVAPGRTGLDQCAAHGITQHPVFDSLPEGPEKPL